MDMATVSNWALPSNFIRTAEKLKHEKQHFVVE
jgi:hypothetical protein